MAIDRTGISSLDAGASDITYSGNEGPRSPQQEQQMQQMKMASLMQEYKDYVMQQQEAGKPVMPFEEWVRSMQSPMAYGGTARPTYTQSRRQRINAAGGGIMGSNAGSMLVAPTADGSRPGYGDWKDWIPNELKDPVVTAYDKLIPNELKNPMSAIAAGTLLNQYGIPFTGTPGDRMGQNWVSDLISGGKKMLGIDQAIDDSLKLNIVPEGENIVDEGKRINAAASGARLPQGSPYQMSKDAGTLPNVMKNPFITGPQGSPYQLSKDAGTLPDVMQDPFKWRQEDVLSETEKKAQEIAQGTGDTDGRSQALQKIARSTIAAGKKPDDGFDWQQALFGPTKVGGQEIHWKIPMEVGATMGAIQAAMPKAKLPQDTSGINIPAIRAAALQGKGGAFLPPPEATLAYAQGGRIGFNSGGSDFQAWLKGKGLNFNEVLENWNFYSNLAQEYERLENRAQGGRIGYQAGNNVNPMIDARMQNTYAENVAGPNRIVDPRTNLTSGYQPYIPVGEGGGGISEMMPPGMMPPGMESEMSGGISEMMPSEMMPSGMMPPGMMPPGIPGGSGDMQDPMLTRYGINQADVDKMTMDQQDDLLAKIDYTNQFGQEPQTQAMLLKEKGIDPNQYRKADGSWDRMALTEASLRSDINELYRQDPQAFPNINITGKESFTDLINLNDMYKKWFMSSLKPAGISGTSGTYVDPSSQRASIEQLTMGFDPETRSAARKSLFGGAPSGMYQGGRIRAQEGGLMDLGGMEKDYRQEGGFVPLGGEERADDVPARLSKNEFVFTADAVRAAGGGDIDRGAEVMENVMNNLEQGGQVSEESQGLEGARNMFATAQRLEGVL